MRHTVLLYNPVSTSPGKQRLPLSLLSVAAVIAADYDVEFIDGNLIRDESGVSQPEAVAARIIERAKATNAKLLACTVMPGPQLRQAAPVCKAVKAAVPDMTILWGGYFGTQHQEVVLKSGYIDYVIQGQGEAPFRQFVDTLHRGGSLESIMSLCYLDKTTGEVCVNDRAPNVPIDNLPWFPYERLNIDQYVGRSYLGNRVLNHNTSFGCPFACNFCAVVALSKRRWIAESAERMANIVGHMADNWHIDGLEFHDMDFFVNEERTADFAERVAQKHGNSINWWALGRVDTLMGYSDDTWDKMKRSGAKMLFMGAESGDDETLKRMNKGGKSGTAQTLALVERMKHYGIVPELSFVMGNPPDPRADIESTINFIRKIKTINPATELVLYIYTPVPQEGSILLDEATKLGFAFPKTLDEWAGEEWSKFSMRRDPGTPWFKDTTRRRVRNFESVINAYYPTVTDFRLHGNVRNALKALSGWRYKLQFYDWPYELKALQRLIHYRRPETTGF
jgi:anaerobic magnesium-protoporphyrin IX monomethyl ester cyclase